MGKIILGFANDYFLNVVDRPKTRRSFSCFGAFFFVFFSLASKHFSRNHFASITVASQKRLDHIGTILACPIKKLSYYIIFIA
jgi:hypothetical protein